VIIAYYVGGSKDSMAYSMNASSRSIGSLDYPNSLTYPSNYIYANSYYGSRAQLYL